MRKPNMIYPPMTDTLCEDMEAAVQLRFRYEDSLAREERCLLDWVVAAYANAEPVEVSELEKVQALMRRLRGASPEPEGGTDES